MRKPLVILGILLACLCFINGAGAQGLMDWRPPWADEVPQLEPAAWEDGQYVTYSAAINAEDVALSGDMRFAIIGEEEVDGENYFWFEFDIFNAGEMPEDIGDFESLKVQVLMKEYDMTVAQDDPEALMKDLFSMEFIKRVIYQLNDGTPYELDLSFLQGMSSMMEMSMDMAMGDEEIQEEMMGMWDDADWGADYKDISVAAGSFDDALHLWFAMNQDEGSVKMDIYSHQDVPLVMLVKMAGKVKDTASGGLVDMDFELIEYGDDAEGWITGEPEMFSFEMMGGMMGGM